MNRWIVMPEGQEDGLRREDVSEVFGGGHELDVLMIDDLEVSQHQVLNVRTDVKPCKRTMDIVQTFHCPLRFDPVGSLVADHTLDRCSPGVLEATGDIVTGVFQAELFIR